MYVRHSHNVDGWRACIHDLKKLLLWKLFPTILPLFLLRKTVLLCPINSQTPLPTVGVGS